MSVQITLDGRTAHDVRVTRSGARAVVYIDGIACATSLGESGGAGASILDIEGRRETVWWVVDADFVFLHVLGRAWKLQVTDPTEASASAGASSDRAVAPMPGVVVSVGVEAGQEVKRGQVLAVIESMKMHSEITAPRDGTVDRVLVRKGETFNQGAALVTLVSLDASKENA